MKSVRALLVAIIFVAMGLFSGAGLAQAQEEAGEQVDTALVEGVAYVCQSAERAGEIDFFVAGISEAAEDGDCRLAYDGEFTFTISMPELGPVANGSTEGDGVTSFDVPAPSIFEITEDVSGVSTGEISVEVGDYVSVTFVQYVEAVDVQEPGLGTGRLQIEHKICENGDRADETDFFAGGTAEASESPACWFGVGTTFTVTPIDVVQPVSVEGAGDGSFTLTTDVDGLTESVEVASGTYMVTENDNGAESSVFTATADAYVAVTVVDYVAPEGDVATLAIHKAECETGVGPDIFETCHENSLAGVTFSINGTEVTTDEEGWAGVELDPGDVEITEDEADFDDYLGSYVYCSEQKTGLVLFDGDTQDGTISFEALADDEIVCDWYNITAAATAPDDDDDDKDDTDDVTTLPSTGAGVTAVESNGIAFLLLSLVSVAAVAGVYGIRTQRN